jgi:putative flippase GtrA
VTLRRLMRFGAVGVLNTGIYYGCYLLLRLAIPYIVAHICATGIAMVCSYFLNCYITFRTPPRWRTFLLFPLSNAANICITTAGLPVAVQWLHLDERIAPLPVALTAIPITYVVAHAVMVGRPRGRTAAPSSAAVLTDGALPGLQDPSRTRHRAGGL